jgi:hypothetical protein
MAYTDEKYVVPELEKQQGNDDCPVECEVRAGRYFESGAYRDSADDKPRYAGFLSPLVIRAYGQYMLKHQKQSDGNMRGPDNWKLGMDQHEYLESAWRHLLDLWLEDEGHESRDGIGEALGGLLFNVMGYWHEHLKGA